MEITYVPNPNANNELTKQIEQKLKELYGENIVIDGAENAAKEIVGSLDAALQTIADNKSH